MMHLCFCSNLDIFFLHSATLWSVCVLHEEQKVGFPAGCVQGLLAQGSRGLRRAQKEGSGDENSCLLWLVAASAHSGKSVELEPSCESPHGNKSFLTSPLAHHTTAQNQACVSALLVCVNVHICSGSACVAVSVNVGVCTQLDLSFIPLPGITVLSYAWGALCCL